MNDELQVLDDGRNLVPYAELPQGFRQELMDSAAKYLLLKPELIGEVSNDEGLLARIDKCARLLYCKYLPSRRY